MEVLLHLLRPHEPACVVLDLKANLKATEAMTNVNGDMARQVELVDRIGLKNSPRLWNAAARDQDRAAVAAQSRPNCQPDRRSSRAESNHGVYGERRKPRIRIGVSTAFGQARWRRGKLGSLG